MLEDPYRSPTTVSAPEGHWNLWIVQRWRLTVPLDVDRLIDRMYIHVAPWRGRNSAPWTEPAGWIGAKRFAIAWRLAVVRGRFQSTERGTRVILFARPTLDLLLMWVLSCGSIAMLTFDAPDWYVASVFGLGLVVLLLGAAFCVDRLRRRISAILQGGLEAAEE